MSNYIEHPASGKTGTFAAKYDQHAERNGQSFTVLGAVDPKTYDAEECGTMFRIRFADGAEVEAWPEEVESAMSLQGNVSIYIDHGALADKAFAEYEFGEGVMVTDTSGWEYTTPGHERTRKVYVETEREDDGPAPRWTLNFTVRFDPTTGVLSEAFAMDEKGQVWGTMPSPRELPGNVANYIEQPVSGQPQGHSLNTDPTVIEARVMKDYAHYLGKDVLVKGICGFVGDDSTDVELSSPAKVRVEATSEQSLKRWIDGWCVPLYEVTLVENHPQLNGMRSLWIHGPSLHLNGKQTEASDIVSMAEQPKPRQDDCPSP